MKKIIRGTALCLVFAGLVAAQQSNGVSSTKKITVPANAAPPAAASAASAAEGGEQPPSGPTGTAGNGIFYHGGPVILGVTNVYYIWYGNWSVDPNALPILQNFAQSVGGSPYFAINTTYFNSNATAVTNAVAFNGSTTDNYSQGTTLSDAGVLAVVAAAINSGRLPKDLNAVYFVLTSPDVKESSGFITQYCGWHDSGIVSGSRIRFAFVGDSATQGIGACTQQRTVSPNNDPAVDGMVSVVAHELEEAVTDPDLNAWYDNAGNENADKCAWTFGTTYTVANGSSANMNLGGRDYLIQRNWVNAAGGYCALALPPSISSVTPNSGAPGSTVSVSISGASLTGGTVAVSGTGVTAAVISPGANSITASLTIAAGAATGARSVSVTTPGGTSGNATFTVTGASTLPTLTSISPASGAPGTSVNVTLTGTNFIAGSQVRLAGAGASQTNIVVVSSTQITATFTLSASVALGPHNCYVVTSAGNSNILPFNVTAASSTPTLTGIAPNSGTTGSSLSVTLTGTNFIAGATVNVGGTGVTASNVTVVSATQITVTLAIAANAAVGSDPVTVTTSGGTSSPLGFTVNQAAPVLTGITPASGVTGSSVSVTLAGSNFVSPATVNVGVGITVSNVSVVNASQITATLTIAANAAAGATNISVATAGGTSGAVSFTVNQAAPVLTAVTPTSGTQGTSVNVTLSGSNFAGGAVNVSGSGVTASNVTVVNSSQITATLTIAANAAPGAYNVSVTTAGGTSGAIAFNVGQAAPVLASVAPASGTQGTTVNVTLSGSNFAGAAVNVSGSGVTASNVTVVNSNQITATLTIAASAAVGGYNVSVTTAGGTSGAIAFNVGQAAPVLASVAPASGTQGTSVNVTLSGSNFAGAAVNVSGSGVTASNVTVVNSSQITATLTIAANAAPGAYNVSITTLGGTSNSVNFGVTAASTLPTLSSITPPSGSPGTTVNVTLTGTNFLPGASIRLAGIGASFSNVVVVSSTQITATFKLTSAVATGPHNVYVVTSAGNSNIVPFVVN